MDTDSEGGPTWNIYHKTHLNVNSGDIQERQTEANFKKASGGLRFDVTCPPLGLFAEYIAI
jgi:hypothetical protein